MTDRNQPVAVVTAEALTASGRTALAHTTVTAEASVRGLLEATTSASGGSTPSCTTRAPPVTTV